jgi:DNA polymerase-3 subunit beta
MRFTVTRDDLVDAMSVVMHAPVKEADDVFSNVLLRTEEDKVCLRGMNMDLEIERRIPAHVETAGGAAVSAALFQRAVKGFPRGEISVYVDTATTLVLVLENPRTRVALECLTVDAFPAGTGALREPLNEIIAPQSVLLGLLEKVKHAICTDSTRTALCGVQIGSKGGMLTAVSSDGRRMAVASKPISGDMLSRHVVIPSSVVKPLIAMLGTKGEVDIRWVDGHFELWTEDSRIAGKVTEEAFPDYEKVVPQNAEISAVTGRVPLINALNAANALTTEFFHQVDLTFLNGLLSVQIVDFPSREFRENVPAMCVNTGASIRINPAFGIAAMKEIETEEVAVKMVDDERPLLIEPMVGKEHYVIMPIKKDAKDEEKTEGTSRT